MSIKIDIHADDFGESIHASEDILDCIKAGKLDSISILTNMSCFETCVKRYREEKTNFPKKPKISVHLNFMEGSCLADPKKLPGLVDAEGHFCISWGKLFLQSFLPGKKKMQEQLQMEMELQIRAFRQAFPELKKLRFDSHQHTHMIPVVAAALFEVIRRNNLEVEYIRDSREPMLPFLKEISLYPTYRPVNFVKNMILNFCSWIAAGKFRKMKLEPMYLWGLVMSGHMDKERVEKLMPQVKKAAGKQGRTLEILFHPGQVLKEEITPEFSQKEAIEFHVSRDRQVEKQAVIEI
ncbi:MAG: ChbG/HpnK family deacetylase [Eisenbergiella sp.]